MKNEYKISIGSRVFSAIMLFLALGYHPYSYYIILRWVLSGSSFYSGWVFSKLQRHNWAWFFFITGILFNPIFPFYLKRSTWQLIDLVFGTVFFISLTQKYDNQK